MELQNNGMFSVKSAYRLVASLDNDRPPASCNVPSGEWKMWQNIWTATVPNKVQIFSWRLACNNLSSQRNKWRSTLEVRNTYTICGTGVEDSNHDVVECTKERALRHKMRELWALPKEEYFAKTVGDWLLILLENTKKEGHQAILLTLWRSWHLRNDIIHGIENATINYSAKFLLSYENNLKTNTHGPVSVSCTDLKGKKKIMDYEDTDTNKEDSKKNISTSIWNHPHAGWLKTNMVGSFVDATGEAAVGVVIRGHQGHTIVVVGFFWKIVIQPRKLKL